MTHVYVYATDHKAGYVLRKLQRGHSAIKTRHERWNIKINEDKSQAIYVSHRLRPPEAHLTLNGWSIPFVNHVKYFGAIFDENYMVTDGKAFRTFIRLYSLFKNDRLSANIKLTLHKALISSVMTYVCPAWEFAADTCLLKL
jgi:hypothetical protein